MEIIDDGLNLIQHLDGKKVVIFGGTGSVGEGILRSYLKSNAMIIIPSRSEESKNNLLEILGNEGNNENLKFIISDYSDFEGAEKTAKMIEENFGKIDTVIACVGGWWSGGPIWKVNEESWKNHFLGLATTHMALAKAWVSRLDKSGSYQIISGGSGKHAVEGSGIVSMQHAALIMMAEALGLEAKDSRVFAFVLGVVNSRNRPAHKSYWITAEQVGMVSTILANDELLASQIIEIKDKADLPDVLDKLIQ